MIQFFVKGVIRDRSRSLFSFIVVTLGVFLAVIFRGFMAGVFDDMMRQSAIMQTGHVKVATRAYAEEADLMPNDLAILEVDSLITALEQHYPALFWTPRITFAGLLDVPDAQGETRKQGAMMGVAIDFFSESTRQIELWDLNNKLTSGNLPRTPEEVLLGNEFARRLEVEIGDVVTFIGGTMYGGFASYNFTVAGTVSLGVGAFDRNILMVDLEGARQALDMENAASFVMGFYQDMFYDDPGSVILSARFNDAHSAEENDVFGPVMHALRDQQNLGAMVDLSGQVLWLIIGIFMFAVTVVLWNLGLMNGLRRYGEIGVRLAMGETKTHVFGTMLIESLVIGMAGTVVGTAMGLLLVLYLQEVGLDYSALMENYAIPVSTVMRGKITPDLYVIGVVPGIFATLIGTMLAGRGIYKRELSQLFKELET